MDKKKRRLGRLKRLDAGVETDLDDVVRYHRDNGRHSLPDILDAIERYADAKTPANTLDRAARRYVALTRRLAAHAARMARELNSDLLDWQRHRLSTMAHECEDEVKRWTTETKETDNGKRQ